MYDCVRFLWPFIYYKNKALLYFKGFCLIKENIGQQINKYENNCKCFLNGFFSLSLHSLYEKTFCSWKTKTTTTAANKIEKRFKPLLERKKKENWKINPLHIENTSNAFIKV